MPDRTLPRMFEDSCAKYGNNALAKEKTGGIWTVITYREMRDTVRAFAAGLMELGIRKGDRVALISDGRAMWVAAELGILYAGAINVPVSVKVDEQSDLKFRLAHSGCRAVVVSGSQLMKVRAIEADLAELEKVIVLDRPESPARDEIFVDDFLASGRSRLKNGEEAFDSVWRSIRENDPANICYTSGTTADPKGIVLTHRNYTANVEQASSLFEIPESYTSLLILPWDHAFAHTAGIYTLIRNGASFASVQTGKTALETLRNVPVNIRETQPSFLLSVPALAKSFRKAVEQGVRDKGPKAERLFRAALHQAYAYHGEGNNRGKGLRLLRLPFVALFDKVFFSKIRENFGGKLEFFVGGGALLDIDLQRFFNAIGIPMYQGYGLTEAAPIISSNSPRAHKFGTSGKIVPGLEVKFCDTDGKDLPPGVSGEIVIRGENVMSGYWKNDKATAETLRGGWLHTGDLGYIDGDGYLMVLGRSKSLLIGNDGEKFSPEGIEEAIEEASEFIDQVMLHNNQNPYTAALVVPNVPALRRELAARGLDSSTVEGQDAALSLIESAFAEFRDSGKHTGEFPPRWLPAAVAVLGEAFTEQNRFLNSTMKMVRPKITAHYRARLDYLYTPEGKDIRNHQNRTIVGRW
jgi:long-chain acyl-CoA synthetase